jgi:hypothetical protein
VARDMDRKHRRLFSSGRDPKFLVLMDADSGRVLQSLPISSGADANVFESETGLLFVSTRAGKLHIFREDSPDKLSEVETVETEFGAKTMNIDPKTHNLFLTTDDFGSPWSSNQEASPSAASADSWSVSPVDLWALEKSSRILGQPFFHHVDCQIPMHRIKLSGRRATRISRRRCF